MRVFHLPVPTVPALHDSQRGQCVSVRVLLKCMDLLACEAWPALLTRAGERRICQCERDHFGTSSMSAVSNQYIGANATEQLDEAYLLTSTLTRSTTHVA